MDQAEFVRMAEEEFKRQLSDIMEGNFQPTRMSHTSRYPEDFPNLAPR